MIDCSRLNPLRKPLCSLFSAARNRWPFADGRWLEEGFVEKIRFYNRAPYTVHLTSYIKMEINKPFDF